MHSECLLIDFCNHPAIHQVCCGWYNVNAILMLCIALQLFNTPSLPVSYFHLLCAEPSYSKHLMLLLLTSLLLLFPLLFSFLPCVPSPPLPSTPLHSPSQLLYFFLALPFCLFAHSFPSPTLLLPPFITFPYPMYVCKKMPQCPFLQPNAPSLSPDSSASSQTSGGASVPSHTGKLVHSSEAPQCCKGYDY